VIPKEVVSLLQHLRDVGDLGVTMGVMGGGVVTPLSAIRLCGRKSATKRALDMFGSPHLTIGYQIGWYKGDE
jgi:hypothetical protein